VGRVTGASSLSLLDDGEQSLPGKLKEAAVIFELGELSLPCAEAASLLRSSQSELQSGASVDSLMMSDHCFDSLISVAGRKLGGTD
jgi:hypothetical protein